MNRIVGSRPLHTYEKFGNLVGTPYGTPLITRRHDSIFRQMDIEPGLVSGVVLDIGSGDDRLSMELYRARVDAEIHRVNPALSPDAPTEVYFAMTEAIFELSERLSVPIEAIKDWHLHTNPFPDITDLPVADWIFSMYCYPTIDIEHHVDSVGPMLDHEKSIGALASLSKPSTQLVLGPIPTDEHGEAFEDVLAQSFFKDRELRRRRVIGQYLLHILPAN